MDEQEHAFHDLHRREPGCGHLGLHPGQGRKTLGPNQDRTQECSEYHQENSQACTNHRANFDQQVDFYKGYNQEQEKKKFHGASKMSAGLVNDCRFG